ncbi:MAG: signal recognition particle-docking protein FtsY [Bacteroidetes bacterium]|nr:MAG: signal recognition particle-docking protein FtsY [Bacteroidota bacterium]
MLKFFKKKENKEKLDKGLEKTKKGFFGRLNKAILGKSRVDDEVLDELEEVLIASDVGVKTTLKIIERIQQRVSKDKYTSTEELDYILRDEILQIMLESQNKLDEDFHVPVTGTHEGKPVPYVIMVVGVNGVGKTTTIGKLAWRYKQMGKKVLLGAGDTFRAAAVDQLSRWAERVGVDIVDKGMHSDPAAVAYEAVREGFQKGYDVVIVDTAGRLHNKVNLMNELSKIKRSMSKIIPDLPHEVLLVLDASTGQNAIVQADAFTKATQVNALALTKLDGTAKGGVVIGVSDMFQVPVKYIGVGEGMDDLQVFDPKAFVDSLFSQSAAKE